MKKHKGLQKEIVSQFTQIKPNDKSECDKLQLLFITKREGSFCTP